MILLNFNEYSMINENLRILTEEDAGYIMYLHECWQQNYEDGVRADFTNVDFDKSHIKRIFYKNREIKDFRKVIFKGAKLTTMSFIDTDLRGADFTGADIRWVSFNRANIKKANFSGAISTNADFTDAIF